MRIARPAVIIPIARGGRQGSSPMGDPTPGGVVVVVVDSPDGALVGALRECGFTPVAADTADAAAERAAGARAAVVSWATLGPASIDAVRALVRARPGLPVVVTADDPPVGQVVALVKAGAVDVVPGTTPALGQAIQTALAGTASDAPTLEDTWAPAASEAMRRVERQAEEAALLDLPVLLTGEVGVGKQRLARLIHERSSRARRAFERVNCAALPADMLERELFGDASGSGRAGRLEAAAGGTCVLAEIGEAPPGLQARLAHVLTEGRAWRVGDRGTFTVDVRVIATTSQDPRTLLQAGALRRDLYDAFPLRIHVPALRDRSADTPVLLEHFLAAFQARFRRPPPALEAGTRQLLLEYAWPGNVQELESVVKRFVVLGDESQLREEIEARMRLVATQREALLGRPPSPGPRAALESGLRAIAREAARQAERAAIRQVLDRVNWNRAEAARRLKISYKTLLNKLERDDPGPPPRRPSLPPGSNEPRKRPRRS
jgi:two-component system response regulator AtoC